MNSTRFEHREISGKWYTWDTETDLPVSSGKTLTGAARDRAQVLNEGGLALQKGVPHPGTSDIIADFYRWVEQHGASDPVIAKAYGLAVSE